MILRSLAVLIAFSCIADAQSIPKERPRARPPSALTGWADWEKGEALLRRIQVPPSPVRSAEEEAKTFKLAPGYRIELVACEPMVQCPIFFEFDPDGRIWVIEYQGYMRDLKGSGEGNPICRLVVLEDANEDGRADKQTVYLDKLVMPRSFAFVKGGILLQEPPKLWFCEDTDGDLKCDRRREVGTMGVAGNPQHTANGLRHGLDNWLHCADWPKKYRWQDGKLIEADTIHRGQFGVSFDDTGRFISCYENSAAHMDLIPAEYLLRNPNLVKLQQQSGGRGGFGVNVNIAKNAQEVFPIRPTPAVTLGALELRDDGRLRTYTIVSGACFYDGDQFPGNAHGNLFIPESGGHLIGRLKLEGGIEPAASRFYPPEQEFLASTDERFRPVNARTGPDGCLYIADMYHGIIEHIIFMVPWLTKQIAERKLDTGNDLGRIWRIMHEGKPVNRKLPMLGKMQPAELGGLLGHPNGWHRMSAQRLLVEAGDPQPLLAKRSESALGRMHALWALDGMNALKHPNTMLIAEALSDADERVRIAACRLGEGKIASEEILKLAESDPSQRVRLQAALSCHAGSTTSESASRVAAANEHPLFQIAAATALHDAGLEWLQPDSAASTEKKTHASYFQKAKPGLKELVARLVIAKGDSQQIGRMIELAEQDGSLLEWIAAHLKSPVKLAAEPKKLIALSRTGDSKHSEQARGILGRLSWPGSAAADSPQPRSKLLTADEQKRIAAGHQLYATACGLCHQPHGGGVPGAFPPLAGSEWVTGDAERLIRIALQGVYGPIEVKGQPWNLAMPGQGMNPLLDDEKLAAVLSYVRNDWGNEAAMIDAKLVAEVRGQTQGRMLPWTAAELNGSDADPAKAAPPPIQPDAKGELHLTAKLATTHGQKLAYRPSLDVLAPWTVADDSAEWAVELKAAGEFEVAVELAADAESAGDQFIIQTEGSETKGTVGATGGYETFAKQKAGTLKLRAGLNRILMRPEGPLKRELADVRSVVLRLAKDVRQP